MLDSISIKNFKAIQGDDKPLILNNLSKVNYLVGKNGCGKSSVLEGLLLMLNLKIDRFDSDEDVSNYKLSKDYFESSISQDKQIFEEKLLETTNSFFRNYFVTTATSFSFSTEGDSAKNSHISFFPESHSIKAKFSHFVDLGKLNCLLANTNNAYKNSFTFLDVDLLKLFVDLQKYSLCYLEHHNFDLFFNKNLGIYSSFDNLSYGEKFIVNLIVSILFCRQLRIPHGRGLFEGETLNLNYDNSVCLIEEPETNIHPELQKIIPKILNKINQKANIQFFVATHSPFIISSSGEFADSQKVYMIESGQTVDLYGKNSEEGKNGYSGGECLLAVNKMLDSEPDTLFSVIVFCEKSLGILLNKMFEKQENKPKRHFSFTTSGGGDDFKIYLSLKQAYKYNLNNLSIYAVVDKDKRTITEIKKDWDTKLDSTKSEDEQKNCINAQLASSRVFVSRFTELELGYNLEQVNEFLTSKNLPVWNRQTHPEFTKNYCKINNISLKGDLKNELAEYMGSKFTKGDLKKLSEQLQDLIFESV